MSELADFQPDWISPPGATLIDLMDDLGQTDNELAAALEIPVSTLEGILTGERAIDKRIAQSLADHFDTSVEFWIARESRYRASLRQNQPATEDTNLIPAEWLKHLPVGDMIRLGWIEASRKTEDRIAACMQFFGVSSIGDWHQRHQAALAVSAFRTTATYDSNGHAVSAWLRKGEIEAEKIDCQPWNKDRLITSIDQMRRLTWYKEPRLFLPRLEALCASCGIALVIARAPKGCPASGATRFLTESKALILLSFRYLSDDQFWFTFFHEVGHLVLHGKDALFLEDGSDVTEYEETEANAYSQNVLIPPQYQDQLGSIALTDRSILAFAKEVNIAAGIVVGQLQYHGRLKPNRMNYFKRRFTEDSLSFQRG